LEIISDTSLWSVNQSDFSLIQPNIPSIPIEWVSSFHLARQKKNLMTLPLAHR
jgi:hypothetical protein